MTDTSPADPVAEAFEAQRDRLCAVAYRMLGSHADAEDVVQEAWLRLSRQDTATIHNLAGWLTTVIGRISLDVLRSRQAHPEAPYDDRLPELVVTVDDGAAPEDEAALADSRGEADRRHARRCGRHPRRSRSSRSRSSRAGSPASRPLPTRPGSRR
jgi:RNA polymerase sigma-70 factor (ECF subfamily)